MAENIKRCVEQETVGISDLPREVLEHVLSFLSFDEVSKQRKVCRRLNEVCSDMLNSGYVRADRLMEKLQKEVKAKLPRRESERRAHFLARHTSTLAALETRMSLLNMTYMKYIELEVCCFIPGKVLDEIFYVLRELSDLDSQPKGHELMLELRDITSMAMEHFDEVMVPYLKAKHQTQSLLALPLPSAPKTPGCGPATAEIPTFKTPRSLPATQARHPNIRIELQVFKNRLESNSNALMNTKKDMKKFKSSTQTKLKENDRKMMELERKTAKQAEIINELSKIMKDQQSVIGELKTRLGFASGKSEVKDIAGEHSKTEDAAGKSGETHRAGTSKHRTKRHAVSSSQADGRYTAENEEETQPAISPDGGQLRNKRARKRRLSNTEGEGQTFAQTKMTRTRKACRQT